MKKPVKEKAKLFQTKSFLRQFIVSYICILIVPFFTVFFTYFTAEKAVREEILHANEVAVSQIFSIFDERLAGISGDILQVAQDDRVKTAVYSDRNASSISAFARYQLKQYLYTFIREELKDVFIYFQNSDTVVAASGASADSRTFYDIYYSTSGISYEKWISLQKRANYQRNLRTLYTEDGQSTLGYFQSLPMDNLKRINATVCFVLNPRQLQDLLHGASSLRQGAVSVYDESGGLLACSAERFGSVLLSSAKNQRGWYEYTFGNQTCAVRTFLSRGAKCTYMSIIPNSIFWERLNSLRLIYTISIAACMFLSLLLSIAFTRKNYDPVSRMIRSVSSHINLSYNRQKENEADFVSNVLLKIMDEKDMLSKKLESSYSEAQEEFLFKILQGIPPLQKEPVSAVADYGIHMVSDRFCVFLFHLESYDPEVMGDISEPKSCGLLAFMLKNVLEELFAPPHQCFVIRLNFQLFAAVANLGGDISRADFYGICEKARIFFQDQFAISYSVCIGQYYSGLSGIHLSYLDALTVLDYLYILGKNRTAASEEVGERAFQYSDSFRVKAERDILEFFQSDDFSKDADALINEMTCNAISEKGSNLETVKYFQYNAVNLLSSSINGNQIVSSGEAKQLTETLITAKTFQEFKSRFAAVLSILKKYYEAKNNQNDLTGKIKDCIDEHYFDPDLNVNLLGEHLGLSPSYVSKVFKAYYGISPLDYLMIRRISFAKELLASTSDNIEEISAKSGFLSSSVFIRTFKKSEGVTPGKYRSLYQKPGGLLRYIK